MMDCETLLKYLSEYIDNNLDDTLTAAAESHLRSCENCKVMLDSTQRTILLYRAQGTQQLLPDARQQRLYQQIEALFRQRDDDDSPAKP